MNRQEEGCLVRTVAAVVMCLGFSGCLSCPDPEPPPPPFKVEDVRAAARNMSKAIVALPQVASTLGGLNVRFDGVRDRTRFFTEMDIFERMLMRELTVDAQGRFAFFAGGKEGTADNRDIDYVLKGEAIGQTSATYAGKKDFIMVTMMLEDPVSHKVAWQQSFDFEVTEKVGIAYR